MHVRFLSKIAAVLFLAGAQSAYSIIDDYSTGPGQGAPDQFDDVWQSVFNGWGLVPSADEDNDGCTNLVESLAGSDPRNPGDCFAIGNMVIGGSNIIFTFDAQKGKRYQVWQSDSPAGGSLGAGWTIVPGAEKVATIEGSDTIIFSKPSNARKFYRLEATDVDADGDGISDWSEYKTGSNPNVGTSAGNASGGTASDLATLKSLLSLTATPGVATAFEKEGTAATVRLQRSVGTMALTVSLASDAGTADPTKSNAVTSDFVFKNLADVMTNTVTLPAGQGVSGPAEVAKVSPVADILPEVPELLKVCIKTSNAADGAICASTTVKISDANPTDSANRTLYVAYLGREADAISTASGYATALVNGDNTNASITVVFNNLSSEQNTAYIRYGPNNDLAPALPNGQVSGFNYSVAYKPGFLSSDQAFLTALGNGSLSCVVSSANYSDKEIFGYFNKVVGSVNFNANNDDLVAPALGSAGWQAPTGDALEREIWRFMSQATFGGTTALYSEIRAECDLAIAGGGTYILGLSRWLDKQMDTNQTPQINLQQLMIAADMEEFALRGNKPITYNSDPQLNGGSIPVSYVNGMPVASATNPNTNDPGNNNPSGGNGESPNRRREWWTLILQSKDHVRQRVAQALHEITVISERDATVNAWGYGAANYWDMLASGAFGKYRTLLEQVSLNPVMGVYLTSVANRAAYDAGGGLIISPDENYAREIMQLFSIGLVLRHPDGSLQLNSEGLPIATYDNNDITSLARVFTGFSFGARHGNATTQILGQYGAISSTTQRISPTVYLNGTTNNTWFGRDNGHLYWQAAWTYPMKTMGRIGTTVYHDFNEKTLLAGKHGELYLPAQAVTTTSPTSDTAVHNLAAAEVSRAHDVLAGSALAATYGDGSEGSPGHTNTPINISRWLIQRLVTSNPSAGYIYRVQKVYRDNNGLLGPVIKAILLDWEARSLQLADTSISFGKVKEPLVHFAAILRQFKAFSGAPVSLLRDMSTGFSDLDAPMTGGYSAGEYAKFSLANANPASKPTGWPDGPFRIRIDSLRSTLGQSPQDAPSVFNWFLPDFIVPGNMAQAGLFAPELQIATEAAEVSKLNLIYNYTWMTLAGMSTQPGVSGANFVFRNAWATPAVRFSSNGGTTLMGWPATITLDQTNWNTGVTVTMVGVNDQRMNTLASSEVRYAVSGAAVGYSGVATQGTPITFVDNEVKNERLVITPTGGNTWIQEGGSTDVVSVMLAAPPSSGTTVNIALATQNGEATLSPVTLSFTESNWNAPQDVTVTAVDDSDVEDTGTGNEVISFTTTSDAANYNGIVTAPHSVSVVDNDNALGVLITQTGGTTDVAETSSSTVSPLSAGMDTHSIVLTKAPTASITINCTGNGLQVNQTPTSTTFATTYTRVFTTTNWNVPQIVVVRGNNDTTSEGPHTGTITHTLSAAAGGYLTTLPIQQIVATIVDDDNAIILAHSGIETRVMEGGDVNDTITVRLRTNPSTDVSLTLGGNGLKFTPSLLTFKPTGSADSLWSVEQTVTVSALDDYLNEGLLVSNVTAYTNSAGTSYNGTSAPLLPVTILDNDDSRLVVTESAGMTLVNEDGTNDTYTLSLATRPDAGSTTTVSLSPSTTGIQVTPAGPFVFNESNWNTAVTVTVSTTNDGTAETRGTATISHTIVSTDPVYNRSTSPVVLVTIDDNDPPLTIAQTNIFTQVREGGTVGTGGTPNVSDTFTVLLPRAPATGTTVMVTLNPSSQVTVAPSVLTFTSSTTGVGAYTTAQTVTVTAVDDADVEAPLHTGSVAFRLVSTDSYFNGLAAPPVMVQVTDNDSPGISIVESSNTTAVTEGSTTTDSYSVVLTRLPSGNVDVVIDGGTQSRLSKTSTVGTATTTTLNFTQANWSTAQTVWVLPVDDTVAELRHLAPIAHSFGAGSAAEYLAVTGLPSVSSIITDNDNNVTANVVRITESSGSTGVTESGATVNGVTSNSDTITVVLSQAPTSNVTVTFPYNGQLAASPSTLTFIPGATGTGTFNVAQTVTIRSVDDKIMEPILHWGQIVPTVSSADAFFNGKTVTPITSSIYDNDGPSVNVQITGTNTVLTESGVTDTYSVVLSSEPISAVTVTITPDAQLTANVASLVFTASAGATPWNVPQTVTLTAVNDTTAETVTHNGIITHAVSSTDPLYSNLSVPTLTAQIWDNDVPGIDVTHAGTDTSSTVVTEGGANDAILIKLNTQPEPGTSVTITLYPPAYYVPPPQIAKTTGYFINDQGSSNERDNIVIDYTESIQLYRYIFYSNLRAAYGGVIPSPFPTTPSAADNIKLQNAHWAATKAMIDKMDIWFSGGGMKSRNPILIEPNQPLPVPLPQPNARQAIMDAIYAHSGGNSLPATTRYTPEVIYNAKSPPTDTFSTDVRDRCRWAGYLMTVGAPGLVSH